jgi:chemotaxis protein MotB
MLPRITFLLLFVPLAACGIAKEDHDRLMKQALDRQSQRYIAQMRKTAAAAQAAREKADAEHQGQMSMLEASLQTRNDEMRKLRRKLDLINEERDAARDMAKHFEKTLSALVDAGRLQVSIRKGRMTLKLPDDILFPPGSRHLRKEGREAIEAVAAVLKDVGKGRTFLIAGHTDDVPTSGLRSNWELSTARALTVVHLLVDSGVEPARLAATGYGEYDPVADNSTPEGRQQNRRIEIMLMPDLGALSASEPMASDVP